MSRDLFPIALDLDGALRRQPELWHALSASIDATGLGETLRLRTGRAAAGAIRSRIRQARAAHPGPWLAFLGSGDWHHLSLVLLETLAPSRPFTLVLIDNHPDWSCLPPRYHCGNWVSAALRMRSLERAAIVGLDGPDLGRLAMVWSPLSAIASGRVRVHPRWQESAVVPFRRRRGAGATTEGLSTRLRFASVSSWAPAAFFSHLARSIAGSDIYISIDKDCLRPADAACDWEQGHMTLDELTSGLRSLRDACTIIGADVCGDRALSPLQGFIKRLDAGRLRRRWAAPAPGEHARNQAANLAILEALTPTPAFAKPENPTWTLSHG